MPLFTSNKGNRVLSKTIKRVIPVCLALALFASPVHADTGTKLLTIKDGNFLGVDPAFSSPRGKSLIFQDQNPLQKQFMKLAIVPVDGKLTSGFGPRKISRKGHTRMHKGIDLSAPKGTEIVAAAAGTVIAVSKRRGYGNTVDIDHGNNLVTRYAHLGSYNVQVGEAVKAGDKLGTVGRTGRTTGYCLHFETIVNGEAVDPLQASLWGSHFADAAPALKNTLHGPAKQQATRQQARRQQSNTQLSQNKKLLPAPQQRHTVPLLVNTLP